MTRATHIKENTYLRLTSEVYSIISWNHGSEQADMVLVRNLRVTYANGRQQEENSDTGPELSISNVEAHRQ